MSRNQRGSSSVEFALAAVMFFMFLLAVIEFSRMLYTWNAANQAARMGARYAVVCDDGLHEAQVLTRMQDWLPQITAASVEWSPAGCDSASCESVTVGVTGLNYTWLAPVPSPFDRVMPMPSFTTPLRREVMRQDPNSYKICS